MELIVKIRQNILNKSRIVFKNCKTGSFCGKTSVFYVVFVMKSGLSVANVVSAMSFYIRCMMLLKSCIDCKKKDGDELLTAIKNGLNAYEIIFPKEGFVSSFH